MVRKRKVDPTKVRIPGASAVSIVDAGPDEVTLRRPGVTAKVLKDGTFDVKFWSESIISEFMMRDVTRTEELQRRFLQVGSDEEWLAWLRHWIEPPPAITYRSGVLVTEWAGGAAAPPRRAGELGMSEDTTQWNEPFFKGSKFRFAHFKTQEKEEGAVIQWLDSATGLFHQPVVYLGDFAGFISFQSVDDPEDPEEWREYNDLFENAFMWALENMGSFDEPGLLAPVAIEAIAEDPEMLLTESVEKILARPGHPPELLEVARDAAESRGLA